MVGCRSRHAAAREELVNRFAAFMLAASTVVVLFGDPLYAAWTALIVMAAAWILDPSALRTALRFSAVVAIVFAASITAAVVAWAEGPERGIELGGMVLLRLLVLTVAAAVLVHSANAETLLRTTQKMGFDRLGLVAYYQSGTAVEKHHIPNRPLLTLEYPTHGGGVIFLGASFDVLNSRSRQPGQINR